MYSRVFFHVESKTFFEKQGFTCGNTINVADISKNLKQNPMLIWIKRNIGIKKLFVFLAIILVVEAYLYEPLLYKSYKKSRYEGPLKAVVTKIIPKEELLQLLSGPKTIIAGYYISYTFNLQKQQFSNIEFIKTDPEVASLYNRFTEDKPVFVGIKYSGTSPFESYISDLKPDWEK
jgi:hypothetical protein